MHVKVAHKWAQWLGSAEGVTEVSSTNSTFRYWRWSHLHASLPCLGCHCGLLLPSVCTLGENPCLWLQTRWRQSAVSYHSWGVVGECGFLQLWRRSLASADRRSKSLLLAGKGGLFDPKRFTDLYGLWGMLWWFHQGAHVCGLSIA